eukprot:1669921-Amphidinium_carterae.1
MSYVKSSSAKLTRQQLDANLALDMAPDGNPRMWPEIVSDKKAPTKDAFFPKQFKGAGTLAPS